MRRFYILFFLIIAMISPIKGETIIYENISTSQYKTIQVDSDLCSLLECRHAVYVDGFMMGRYADGDFVQIPDNSTVLIVLDDPINTNLEGSLDNGKPVLTALIMALISGPTLAILFSILFLLWLLRRIKR